MTTRGAVTATLRPPWWVWIVSALGVAVAVAIRVRLMSFPLDRDEGEYAYMGRLVLDGIAPYTAAYNMKLPGTSLAYAAIFAFGATPVAIRLGLLAVNLATCVLVFLIGRRLSGVGAGLAAAAAFAVLSVSPAVLGFAAYAEHFVLLPALAGFLLLLRGVERGGLSIFAVAGVLFGVALLMKQHGVFFLVCAALYVAVTRSLAAAALLVVGGVVPLAATVAWLTAAGAFPKFWFWTVTYGWQYATATPLALAPASFLQALRGIVPAMFAPLGLALLGAGLLIRAESAPARWPIVLLTTASLLALTPGFYFRVQYFIFVLPAVALLVGVATGWLAERFAAARGATVGWAAATVVLVTALAQPLLAEREALFRLGAHDFARRVYRSNPVPESAAVGRYLEQHTAPTDRIAVIGSEPEIYFYAKRRSATGYIYTYALMESHPLALGMQREMIAEIESARPAYVVYVNVPVSWLATSDSQTLLHAWFERYQRERLEQVAVVEMVSDQFSVFHAGADARTLVPRVPFYLTIYRQRRG